jgi:Protein of unknown function (DUF3307)
MLHADCDASDRDDDAMTIPLLLLIVHFVGDFLLQSDYMALNKSKSWRALTLHVSVYAVCFTPWGLTFIVVTWITHFLTDAVTSRINARLWTRDRKRWFFVALGADQLMHAITLAWTYQRVTVGTSGGLF